MGLEFMGERSVPCRCSEGVIVTAMYMDDWNRTEYHSRTICSVCQREDEIREAELEERQRQTDACLEQARSLARERHLARWLSPFENCSIKEAWLHYTGGSGHPALGTFYKHVKHAGGLAPSFETNG